MTADDEEQDDWVVVVQAALAAQKAYYEYLSKEGNLDGCWYPLKLEASSVYDDFTPKKNKFILDDTVEKKDGGNTE